MINTYIEKNNVHTVGIFQSAIWLSEIGLVVVDIWRASYGTNVLPGLIYLKDRLHFYFMHPCGRCLSINADYQVYDFSLIDVLIHGT